MKNNRGVTLTDVVIAIIILSLFVGVIGGLFYQIAYNNNLIKYNAVATYYAVKVAEDIDRLAYDDVDNTALANYISENYDLPNEFTITVNVVNYNEDDNTREDILKIATIDVQYTCLNENISYKLKKLKVKEI